MPYQIQILFLSFFTEWSFVLITVFAVVQTVEKQTKQSKRKVSLKDFAINTYASNLLLLRAICNQWRKLWGNVVVKFVNYFSFTNLYHVLGRIKRRITKQKKTTASKTLSWRNTKQYPQATNPNSQYKTRKWQKYSHQASRGL